MDVCAPYHNSICLRNLWGKGIGSDIAFADIRPVEGLEGNEIGKALRSDLDPTRSRAGGFQDSKYGESEALFIRRGDILTPTGDWHPKY